MSTKSNFICSLLNAAVILLVPGTTLLSASAQGESNNATLFLTANNIEHVVQVSVPANWSVTPQTFKNARSMVNVPPGASGSSSTEVQIYVEPRKNHADALNQILEVTSAVPNENKFVNEIGGWPAMLIKQLEERPQPSQGTQYMISEVLRIRTYIAVNDMLFVVTGTLPADAPSELAETVDSITSSINFGSTSSVQQLKKDLEFLQTSVSPTQGATPEKSSTTISEDLIDNLTVTANAEKSGSDLSGAVVDTNIRINDNGFGELEIAVSPDGLDVVVALQSRRFVSSNDGGENFTNAGRPGAGNGDPSVAIGQSGDFYLAWIDSNCGTNYATFDVTTLPAQTFGYDCTGIARSTDNGVNFLTTTVNPAVVCIGRAPAGGTDPAGACFPDQEHIAADPVNAGAGGGDQIYSTWRNFNSANQDAGLVCSQDSGLNWTAPITLGANSFFPRITVGQDGFVYVAAYGAGNYRLWKFSSCANGLNLEAGFPVNVTNRVPYVCPFAGHDRCDQNPSSQTVAVDDTDPNHIYYAYAQDDAEAVNSYSTIFVRDSTDGGLTWPAARVVQANTAVNARRIMPWLCTTQGDAVVTWYEQAAPVPSDSTHHLGAQVGLDNANNLTSKAEFTISEVPDNWCDTGWRCGTRVAPGASESCPNQPQLAGFCGDNDPNTADSGVRCDFSDEATTPGTYCPQPGPSGNNEICLAGNGCPKYGDYNGNACTGGRLYAAWPSAASPPGVPGPTTPTNTGVLYATVAVNGPPVCDANGPYDAECSVTTTLDGSGSLDPEGQALTFNWTGPFTESPTGGSMPTATFPTPTGLKNVDLLVEDTDGLVEACVAQVTVRDTIAPSLTVPVDKTAECVSPNGTPVDIGTATSFDICDPSVAITNDAPMLFPLSETTVTWTATDDDGNQKVDTQKVTIEDTTPPEVTATLVPAGEIEDDEGRFRIEFSCSDTCDQNATITSAKLNGISVFDGQIVDLEIDDEIEVEWDDGVLEIEAPSFELRVTCEDASGNLSTKTASPSFTPDDDIDDDDDDDDDD